MKITFSLCLLLISGIQLHAQGIGVGNPAPDSSAILDIKSTSQGVLMSRLTTAQRNLINDPAQGLLVFDTDKNTFYMFDGNRWLPIIFTIDQRTLPMMPIIAPEDISDGDNTGLSVDMDGDYAIFGATGDDIGNNDNQGSAYIYYKGNGAWEEQQKLIVPNGGDGDNFGFSVAISGDYAIVGAPFSDLGAIDRGNAYVFKRDGTSWIFQARLRPSDGDANDHFGIAVGILGDYAAVGADLADTSGAVYIFFRDSVWVTNQPHQAKLSPPVAAESQSFGQHLCLSGNEIIISDDGEDFAGDVLRGAVYIFTRTDTVWTQTARLIASDGESYDQFGSDVHLDGDYAVIGATGDDIAPYSEQGSAYVFYRDTGWTNSQPFQSKLVAPDPSNTNFFGAAVSIEGDQIVIGAFWKPNGSIPNAGDAFLYQRSGVTWPLYRNLDDEMPQSGGDYGYSVVIHNYNILIGAVGKNGAKGEIQYINVE